MEGELVFEGEFLKYKRWNGKGKAYYRGFVEFEGEYLNGKRWNGKSFDKNGNVLYEIKDGCGLIKEFPYEGEYLNGERHGKGKEYNWNSLKIEFEGEYLNGKRNGKGKEYNYYDGNILFEGEYLNNKRNGKGIEYDNNQTESKIIYEGEYINGKRNGKGKEYLEMVNCSLKENLKMEKNGKEKDMILMEILIMN